MLEQSKADACCGAWAEAARVAQHHELMKPRHGNGSARAVYSRVALHPMDFGDRLWW